MGHFNDQAAMDATDTSGRMAVEARMMEWDA